MGLGYRTVLFFCTLLFTFSASALEPMTWEEFAELQKSGRTLVHVPDIPATVEAVEAFSQEALRHLDKTMSGIAERAPERISFANTIEALDRVHRELGHAEGVLFQTASLYQNTPVYTAAQAALKKLDDQNMAWLKDPRIRKAALEFAKTKTRSEAQKKLVEKTLINFEKAGNLKDFIADSKLAGLWMRLFEKELEFERVKLRPIPKMLFSADELDGLTNHSLSLFTREGDRYAVSITSWNESRAVITEAHSKAVRDRVWKAVMEIGLPENPTILREITELRREIAKMMQHTSWAAFQLEGQSLKANTIARELNQSLKRTAADFATWAKKIGIKKPGVADAFYHARTLEMAALPEKSHEYFATEKTTDALLDLFAGFYGIQIYRLSGAKVWHQDVQAFAVLDKDRSVLGMFTLDLFPRDHKDQWFWCHELTTPFNPTDKAIAYRPFVNINANFSPPSQQLPAFLTLTDVSVLAHELGHALHSILGKSRYYGLWVAQELGELAELPSTLLEYLVLEPEVMASLSHHYQTGKKLSVESLRAWREARTFSVLLQMRMKAVHSLADLKMHSSQVPGLLNLENALYKEHLLPLPAGTSFLASYDYAIGGYDTRYWTYLWSQALAKRLISKAIPDGDGRLSPDFGQHVRRELFEKDGTYNTADILRGLMGEKPKFCSWLIASKS
jgi:thimet oligopeptidase